MATTSGKVYEMYMLIEKSIVIVQYCDIIIVMENSIRIQSG